MIAPRFFTQAHLRPIPPDERRRRGLTGRRKLWEVMQPIVYRSVVARLQLTVPAGLITDLSSVPRAPLAFLLSGDVAHEEAVLHDFLYGVHLVPRALADLIFDEAMQVTEVPGWQRWMIYQAVHLFGASAYESGPSRLTILNRENWIPAMAATGMSGFIAAGLVVRLDDSAFA